MNFKSTLCCVLLISIAQEILGKQQLNKKQMFGSKSLRCLVCKALVEEVNYVIDSTSPTKKTTTREKDIRNNYEVVKIPYKRSQEQLTDIVESICSHFEDYVQAQSKADKSPAVIRLTTRTGNGMNPDFGNYDVVPDEDLNTRLKFYCNSIVEEFEDDIMDIFIQENKSEAWEKQELCYQKSGICISAKKMEL
uniref:Protein canopy-1 n=1 Tax=Lepeophtheirus salmonis TaxID=72036 RepID=D3PHK6_LEPSM|nr:Protein canopy-1 [Lepeophtheirus salmonis]